MNFNEALVKCKEGKKIKRKGWNGKDQYVISFSNCVIGFYDEDSNNTDYYPMNDKDDGYTTSIFEAATINDCVIDDFLLLKTQQGHITSWLPSITDIQADDWIILA